MLLTVSFRRRSLLGVFRKQESRNCSHVGFVASVKGLLGFTGRSPSVSLGHLGLPASMRVDQEFDMTSNGPGPRAGIP